MKRHLNTSYRLVWNHITGTLVVASELARSRGKRAGVAVALSLAAVTSLPVLAADTVVQAGETVSGGALENHDNQIVFGTANGMTSVPVWSMGRITRPIPAGNGYKMAVSPTTLLSPVVVFRE